MGRNNYYDSHGVDAQGIALGPSFFRLITLAILFTCAAFLLAACESSEERAAGYLATAELRYEEGDVVKAEIEVKNALQIQPKNARARFLLARINESRQEYQEMASNLRSAVDADPQYAEARIKLGSLYTMAGALELAQEQASQLSAADLTRVDAKILAARIAAAKGDIEQAQQLLQEAIAKDPTNIQALGLLASVSATTDLPGALALIDEAIGAVEDDRPLRLLRIQLLQRAGNRDDEVISGFRSLMEDYPGEVVFAYQLARFLGSAGKTDEVESVLRSVVENNPENIEAKLALTQFVANIRGPEQAEVLLVSFANELPDAYELRLVLARLYQQTNRNDLAYKEYERVAQAAGNENAGLTANARMASISLSNGDVEKGEALVEKVLSVDSLNIDALMLRGALNIDRREYRAAVSDLRSVLRKDPDNLQAQLLIARAHNLAGDVVLAEDAYRRVLSIDPKNIVATLEIARVLVTRGKKNDAEDLLRSGLQNFPGDVQLARAMIGLLLSESRLDEAREIAVGVASVEGQEAIGDFLLGGVLQVQDEHELAISAFNRSLKIAPTAREPLRGLVSSMVKLGRTDDAVAMLKKYQVDHPDNLYAKTLLGQVLAGSGDVGAAEELFESALQADESWLPAYTALAGMQSGDVTAQIDIYKRGLVAVPGSQELVLLLGTAYERNGQIEDAIASYEAALKANPDAKAVANNLAALLADYRTDERSFKQALDLASQFRNSDNPAFLDTLGWVYYRMGKYDEAVPLLKKSVEAAGQVPVLRYHLGMGYLAINKPTLAKEQLELALAGDNVSFTGVEDARSALSGL